ncbi:MAG: hypothetical protein R2699_11540 [Acidimicrobiales bacterium]
MSFSVTPTLFVSFDTYAQARTAQNPDASMVPPSAVAVWVDQGADPAAVMAAIDAAVPGVDALTCTQAADEAPGVASVQQSFSVILLLGWLTVGTVIGFFFDPHHPEAAAAHPAASDGRAHRRARRRRRHPDRHRRRCRVRPRGTRHDASPVGRQLRPQRLAQRRRPRLRRRHPGRARRHRPRRVGVAHPWPRPRRRRRPGADL